MRMDRYAVIGVSLSLLWAAVISIVFYGFASRSRAASKPRATRPVVVATEALGVGSIVQPASVKVVQLDSSAAPKTSFARLEDVVGRPVASAVLAEEPILEGRLAPAGAGPGLAPLIPTGMRAVSVHVNEVVGVAGFVLPGMRVDVLVTGRPPGRETSVTTTVLQDIPVLSAGQVIQADPKDQAIKAQVVTLLVSPAQAETLTLANTDGKIHLVLRNSSDRLTARTPGRELSQLYSDVAGAPGSSGEQMVRDRMTAVVRRRPAPPRPTAAPAPAVPAQPAVAGDEVVVIRGNQRTIERPESGGK